MRYEVWRVDRVYVTSDGLKQAKLGYPGEKDVDYVEKPVYRALSTRRRALRNIMRQVGVSGGRQKRRLRKLINKELEHAGISREVV
jgi:hypothetical protein